MLTLLSPVFTAIVLVGGAILVAIALVNQRTTNHRSDPRHRPVRRRRIEFAEDGCATPMCWKAWACRRPSSTASWRRNGSNRSAPVPRRPTATAGWARSSKGVRLLIQIFLLGATGALLILDFQATGGIMIGASIIGARALAPIETIVGSWKSIIALRLAWTRIVDLLEKAPRRDEGMKLPPPKGHLQLGGVSFGSRAAGRTVLSGISLDLLPGEALGIIGPSASGKSTLLRLLIGAWPCTSGVVRLDGANIYSWPRQDLSRYIGYLPQDVELFAGTVRENIARMHDGDPQDVVRAAQRARAHEMILALPKGYDTEVGGNGHRLSGGQSQRIGFARALYGDPRFVVLDEPNSNLDAPGEESLLNALGTLRQEGVTRRHRGASPKRPERRRQDAGAARQRHGGGLRAARRSHGAVRQAAGSRPARPAERGLHLAARRARRRPSRN